MQDSLLEGNAIESEGVLSIEAQFDANMRLFLKAPLAEHDCLQLEQRLPRLPERILDPAQWPRQ
jgi:hypothetical protein